MRGALEGPQVSLAQVLESRDQRVQDQAQWLARGGTLVCMTLNMPGPQKRFPLADAAFRLSTGGSGSCFSLPSRIMTGCLGNLAFMRLPAPAICC